MSSTITIVGIIVCAVVIIIAVVFVIIQRTFIRRRVKYTMTSSDDSPAHQSQNVGSSTEHRVSSAQSSSPSSPGNAINVDMEVPLTGKTQRRGSSSKISRASSASSVGSQKMKRLKPKGETKTLSKGGNKSPKPASKQYTSVISPYGIEIIDIDEKGKAESSNPPKIKTPRTPLLHSSNNRSPATTPVSPITKLDILNKKRQEKKTKAVVAEAERDVTGSSGSRSPSTTKAEVNWPQSTFIKAALNEVSKSLTDKHKHSYQRPPSEEIPLLDSMTSSIESPSHFNNMVKSESTDSATTSFVRPVPAKPRRPTSLTESYTESTEKPKQRTDNQSSGAATVNINSKPSPQAPAILPVKSVQLPSSATTTAALVNNKPPLVSSSASSTSISKYPVKPSLSQVSLDSDKNSNKQKRTAYEERQTSLPKPDGQSPKLQERKNSITGLNGREPPSPGRASRASSKSSRNNISSPARSITTPSEIEGLELEYDDFVEDDPLSYFDYEETQKLAFRGVEKIGKSPVEEEEDEDEV